MTTSIVGASFRGPPAMNAIARLKPGMPLRLVREPNNKYDRFAVAVYQFALHLGYLSRGTAKDISALMDSGMTVNVRAIRAGVGFIELGWSDADMQSPAGGDGFDTFDALVEEKAIDSKRRKPPLVPPKPPVVQKPKPRHFFPELDLPTEVIDTRPDPWE